MDRALFVTGRALLRLVLLERLGQGSVEIDITLCCAHCGSQEHGKPRLIGAGIEFGITHAGGLVGVAVHDNAPVGIDVEPTPSDDLHHAELTALLLSPAEHAIRDRLQPEQRRMATRRWWTRKESVLKAVGVGLAVSPDRLRVTSPDQPPALVSYPTDHPLAHRFESAQLVDLTPPGHYLGCLTVLGNRPSVTEMDGNAVFDRATANSIRMSDRWFANYE